MTKKLRDLAFIIFATSIVWIFYEIFAQVNRTDLPDIDPSISTPLNSGIDQNVLKNLEGRKPY